MNMYMQFIQANLLLKLTEEIVVRTYNLYTRMIFFFGIIQLYRRRGCLQHITQDVHLFGGVRCLSVPVAGWNIYKRKGTCKMVHAC